MVFDSDEESARLGSYRELDKQRDAENGCPECGRIRPVVFCPTCRAAIIEQARKDGKLLPFPF
jgi:hypothetical protein